MSRPLDRLLNELGAAHRKGRIGERILEVDDEHGRPLPRLDRRLSVAAGDPRVVRRELEAHLPRACQACKAWHAVVTVPFAGSRVMERWRCDRHWIPNSAFPAIEAGEDDGGSGWCAKYSVSE